MGISGPVLVVDLTMNTKEYLNISADQLHPYMTLVFPTGNGMYLLLPQYAFCHKARNVLEWFHEDDAEF